LTNFFGNFCQILNSEKNKGKKKEKKKKKKKYWTHYHDQVGMFKSQAADFSLFIFFSGVKQSVFFGSKFSPFGEMIFENNIILSNIVPFF